MPRINVRDIEIYYELHGDAGPTLVLVCGYGQNLRVWEPFLPALTEKYQVLTFDNRGTGRTSAPDAEYTIQQMAADTTGLLEALNIPSAHFIGQSMGTAIILEMCLSHGNSIENAALITPFAHFPRTTLQNVFNGLEFLNGGMSREHYARMNAPWLLSNGAFENDEGMQMFVDLITQDPHPPTLEGLKGQAKALEALDLREALPMITQPLLLIAGERDLATPLYCSEEIYDKTSHCEMYIFPGMGHLIFNEAGEAAMQRALAFLF